LAGEPRLWVGDPHTIAPATPLARRACRTAAVGHARGLLLSTRPGITVAIDQYAEKALGNRDYFLNKPYGVG